MTRANYRHRIIIQDRSGSMGDSAKILAGAQEGLDEFLAGETDPHRTDKVTVSLWDFDTEIRCVASFEEPEAIADLGYRIEPRGGTNLYGAVGQAVTEEGIILGALPEDQRPADVVVLIASDGKHNSTTDWTGERTRTLLKQQQDDYAWRVIYMGCGEEAFREGDRMGTHRGLTVNSVSMRSGYKMSSDYLSRVPYAAAAASAGGLEALDLTEEERAVGEGRAAAGTEEE